MGIAGVRTPDNKQFFDANSPLAVVYYDVDYEHNPKGENRAILSNCIAPFSFFNREQLLEK